LVQQGTELMQGLLSEMFGLDGPDVQESVEELEEEQEQMSELQLESYSTPELETDPESESEPEVGLHDYMDIEAHEHPETDSDAYDDNDGSSDQSDDSMATTYKRKRTQRQKRHKRVLVQEKHEKTLREKRERAREEKKALYTRFGLTVQESKDTQETEEDQGNTHEEERREAKRQKRNHDQPTVLRQTTLNFDKVRKNRRLFSRKELSQSGILEAKEEAEQKQEPEGAEGPDVASPGSFRRNSKKSFRIPPGHRYQKPREISSRVAHLRRRTGR
jgi:hypothetical protein